MKWTKEFRKRISNDTEFFGTDFNIIETGGEIVTNYGLESIPLTDELIQAIKDGNVINFDINGGEYAGLIYYIGGK